MATKIKNFGKIKFIDDDTIFSISYNGTVRLIINKTTGAITFGAADGNPDTSVYGTNVYAETTMNVGSLSTGAGVLNVTGASILAGPASITGTTSYLQLPVLTSTQRDALTPSAGMMIYNSTTLKLEVYYGGVWNAQA